MKESEYLTGQENLLECYAHLPILDKLEGDYAEQLLSMSILRRFSLGETITRQGDFDPWVYVLLEGAVAIEIDDEDIATIDQPGDIFGEMVLIDESDRSASVIARTSVECLCIDAVLVCEMDKAEQNAFYAVFFRLVSKVLAERLRITNEDLVLISKENRLI